MTAPLVFTRTLDGRTLTVTLTPVGGRQIEYRLLVDGVEDLDDRDVTEHDTAGARDEQLAELAATLVRCGYEQVA